MSRRYYIPHRETGRDALRPRAPLENGAEANSRQSPVVSTGWLIGISDSCLARLGTRYGVRGDEHQHRSGQWTFATA